MAYVRRHPMLVGCITAVLILVIGTIILFLEFFDPGSKNDTSTDLVTPTIAAQMARVFEVSPGESQVDFVAQVGGIDLEGVFPVEAGTITLEPVGDELRVLVRLNIDVDSVDTGTSAVNQVLRVAMATGDYPIAFYVATSRGYVPVTEEVIEFALDGMLEVHNVPNEHSMAVEAQLVSGDMWAVATSDLDLADHGVEFPSVIGSTTIKLTARLQAYEGESITVTDVPGQ
ncbi:MAG: YceI family protein [Anaerolineae bacterium]|nr:YceI family protein [Anaerolineae bacterium]